MEYRTEQDLLGELAVPATALHGIDTERALANFPLARRPVHAGLIHAYGTVKLACLLTNRSLGYLADAAFDALEAACHDLREGRLDEHVRVDALQGGAGTSTNMNVNEVLANRALQILGRPLGDYATISPHDHVNLHQSTNDTYPTALKVAAVGGVRALEQALVELVETLQAQEHALADVVKIGRTELQDAVLTTLGRTFSAYAEAFSRDRWRVYKCEERLRVVNLGGTAIGTGMGAPREYIFRVVDQLRDLTGMGLARAENLVDATQNVDVFVEVSGILKACAANLLKVATDLRLLSSGPDAGLGEITLPARQPGSSIMPGKVNPVIPEAVAQAALQVIANDQAITLAAGGGNLELNQYLPLIADNLLANIDLLTGAVGMLRRDCVVGLEPNRARCRQHVDAATAVITSLIPALGYQQAQQVLAHARAHGTTLRAAATALGLLSADEFDALTAPEAVTRLGFVPEKR
jgi:aspartate ammonia-lyase